MKVVIEDVEDANDQQPMVMLKPITRAGLARIGLTEGEDATFFPTSLLDHAAIQVAGMELRAVTPDFLLNAAGDNAMGTTAEHLESDRDQVVRSGRAMVANFVQILQLDRALPSPAADIEEGEIWEKGWDDFQRLLLEGSTGSPDDPFTYTEPIPISEIVDNTLVAEIWDFDRDEVASRP
jgi:hypothetical protein